MKKFFLFLFILFLSGTSFAAGIDEIVFFGDSLSDNGNLYNLLKVIPRSPPYYQGRFSNGPTWAETLGNHYQDQLSLPYTIYAYGGATVLSQAATDRFFAPINLEGELYEFYANSLLSDKSTKLYVFWIGSNDYLMDELTDADSLTTQVVDHISAAITSLISQGAKYFVILNLPDLGVPPYAEANHLKDRLHALSRAHNTKLAKAIENFKLSNPTAKFISIDAEAILNDLLANPEKYNQKYAVNFTVLNQACWQGGLSLSRAKPPSETQLSLDLQRTIHNENQELSKRFNTRPLAESLLKSPQLREAYLKGRMKENGLKPCDHPEQYVFWDMIHPTAMVHDIFSKLVIDTLDNEANDLLIN